jgi:hypothetical protein
VCRQSVYIPLEIRRLSTKSPTVTAAIPCNSNCRLQRHQLELTCIYCSLVQRPSSDFSLTSHCCCCNCWPRRRKRCAGLAYTTHDGDTPLTRLPMMASAHSRLLSSQGRASRQPDGWSGDGWSRCKRAERCVDRLKVYSEVTRPQA